VLITNNYATLKEIRDDYNIDEVLDLYEICKVNLYNKYMTYENMNKRKR